MSWGVLLRAQTLSELYPHLLAAIRDDGRPVAPRGLPTRELLAVTLAIERPTVALLDDPVCVLNPAFAVAEACWVASGSDAAWIFDYNERLREFADAGVLRGAYGPRLRGTPSGVDQLTRVRDLLRCDAASRQGVIQLFDPHLDWAGARDVPCTLGYRFFVRDGCLHQHTSMRSQDAWLGIPYDLFTNSVLHGILAAELGVSLGRCVHAVDSMHLYERDLVQASAVIAAADGRPVSLGQPLPQLACGLDTLDDTVAAVLADEPGLPEGWQQAAATLASYRHWRGGRLTDALLGTERAGPVLGAALRRWYAELTHRRQRETVAG